MCVCVCVCSLLMQSVTQAAYHQMAGYSRMVKWKGAIHGMLLIVSPAVKCVLVLPVEFFPSAALLPCYLPPFPVYKSWFYKLL